MPPKYRSAIAKSGFLNFHQTGKSDGATSGRNAVEASYLGASLNEWSKLAAELKPKYAALYPSANSKLKPPIGVAAFVEGDLYYFNLEKIRERVTLTPGDSLNRFAYIHGGRSGISDDKSYPPQSWDQAYLPWKNRFLLIPCLAVGLEQGQLGFSKFKPPGKHEDPLEFGQQYPVEGQGNLARYRMGWDQPNMDYIEAQIWDKLTLDDVIELKPYGEKPGGEFLQELNTRGIKIL